MFSLYVKINDQIHKKGNKATVKARDISESIHAWMCLSSRHLVIFPSNPAYRKRLSADRDLSKDVACATQRNV